MAAIDVISETHRAAAVMHPLRQRMLAALTEPDSASGLARRFDQPRQKINYHLRELEREGFVSCVQERRKGNCIERLVQATASAFVICPALLGDLGDTAEAAGDRTSSAYLLASATRLIRDVALLRQRADAAGKSLPTLTLQADVRFPSAAARDAFAEELAGTLAEMISRYHDPSALRGRSYRFVVGGHPAVTKTDDEVAAETAAAEKKDTHSPRSTT